MQPQQPHPGQYAGYPGQGQPGAPQGYAPPAQPPAAAPPPKKKGGKLKWVVMGCLAVVLGLPCVLFAGWAGYVKLVENPAPSSDIEQIWEKYGEELEAAAAMAATECRGYVEFTPGSRPTILPTGPTPLARPLNGIDEATRIRNDPRLQRNRTVCGNDTIAGWSNGSHSISGWVFPDTGNDRSSSVSNTWEIEQQGGVAGRWYPEMGLFPFLNDYDNQTKIRWVVHNGRTFVVVVVPHKTPGTPGLGQGTSTIHVEMLL